MSALWGALLGLIQGLTEFLPVSSSGHLVIAQSLLPVLGELPDRHKLALDLALHGATLVALLIFFRRDIIGIGSHGFGRGREPGLVTSRAEARRFLLLVLAGTMVTAVLVIGLEDSFEKLFSAPRQAAWMVAVTGLLLALTEGLTHGSAGEARRRVAEIRWRDALIIGLAQGLAVTPGISRSGATIAAALLLGLHRDLAVRFSFLLSVPAVGGALLLKSGDIAAFPRELMPALVVGSVVAGISGYASIAWLLRLLRGRGLYGLAVYCVVVGVLGGLLLG